MEAWFDFVPYAYQFVNILRVLFGTILYLSAREHPKSVGPTQHGPTLVDHDVCTIIVDFLNFKRAYITCRALSVSLFMIWVIGVT